MTNLAAISNLASSVTSLSNLILVSPQSTVGYQPLTTNSGVSSFRFLPPGKSFVFDYEGENSSINESEITDHFVEDNTAVQDHIALKPETITVHGFIGELNDVPPAALALVQSAANKLTNIAGYQPKLTITALNAYNNALFLYQTAANTLNSAASTLSAIGGALGGVSGQGVIGSSGLDKSFALQSKQQSMYQQIYDFWRNRTLFNVQTPWAVFQNMAILRFRAVQEADTNVITDFEITFKMIRVATTTVSSALLEGRADTQSAANTNNGTQAPPVANATLSGNTTASAANQSPGTT